MKFIKGKYYGTNPNRIAYSGHRSVWIAKFDHLNGGSFCSVNGEHIYNDKYSISDNKAGIIDSTMMIREVPYEEYSKYLPKDHPDLKKELTPNNTELIEGNWYISDFYSQGNTYIFRYESLKEDGYIIVGKYREIKSSQNSGTKCNNFGQKDHMLNTRLATNEEIYKYFPEERQKGELIKDKWYYLEIYKNQKWLFKFDRIEYNEVCASKFVELNTSRVEDKSSIIYTLGKEDLLREATNDEVTKYFPNEFDEYIEKSICFIIGDYVLSDNDYLTLKKGTITQISKIHSQGSRITTKEGDFSANEFRLLIDEVKKRYPIGTKFYPAHLGDSNDSICEVYDYDKLKITDCDYISLYSSDLRNKNNYSGLLIYKGKWAKIVKEEENLVGRWVKALSDRSCSSDTKKGEFYKIKARGNIGTIGEYIIDIDELACYIQISHFELMPIGFNPPKKEQKVGEVWPIGTRVKIDCESKYAYQSNVPGTIIKNSEAGDHIYKVKWDNECNNYYRSKDLILLEQHPYTIKDCYIAGIDKIMSYDTRDVPSIQDLFKPKKKVSMSYLSENTQIPRTLSKINKKQTIKI